MREMIKLVILAVINTVVSIIAGVSVSLWIAKFTAEPAFFLSAGLMAYIVIFFVMAKIFFRILGIRHIRKYRMMIYAAGSLMMVILITGFLLPYHAPHEASIVVKGQQRWDLPSGSKIAYVHLSSDKASSRPPIIFLHGGPGVADMAGDSRYFGQLTSEGFDVYVYDEVGSGHSSRLKDVRGYTVDRDVEDLEFIRQKIGTDKIILIGHSYGGEIAAHYMSKYGSHVEKAVFISPGPINPKDTSSANLINRLTFTEKLPVYKELFAPRAIMTYGLLQVNPDAAHHFAGDKEMDARYDKLYAKVLPALHAKGKPHGPKLSNLGFYVSQVSFTPWAKPQPDIRHALSKSDTESLIIKASADYLSWSSAIDYKKALRNSTLIYFPDAGHNVYQDLPNEVMAVLKAFLTDRPLPVEAYKGINPPADYEGVH